jgi:heterodisulfide reductase subunit B
MIRLQVQLGTNIALIITNERWCRKLKRKAALYPGCLVLYRFPEYEASAKQVLNRLGFEITTLPQAICCGSYLEGISPNWIYFASYNLAMAEREKLSLITLCGGCTNTFLRVQRIFENDPGILFKINKKLAQFNLKITSPILVQHLIQVLYNHREELARLQVRLLPFKIAPTYPCQVYRPGSVMNFDHPLKPQSVETLISITGAIPQHYSKEYECCGSSLYFSNPEAALLMGKNKIQSILKTGADMALTACGNCHLLLDRMQPYYAPDASLPVIFLSQLIGLSLGLDPSDLHLKTPRLKRMIKNAI